MDTKALFDTLETRNVTKVIRLRVDIAQLCSMEENEEINVPWLKRKNLLADCMKNAGASTNNLLNDLEKSQLSRR